MSDATGIGSAGAGGDRYRLVRPLMVGYREVQVSEGRRSEASAPRAPVGPRLRRSGGYERSSIGRAPVSKTGGWGFDSLRSCSSPPGSRPGPDPASDPTASQPVPARETGVMGKVKDGVPASKAPKPAKGKPLGAGAEPLCPVPGEPRAGQPLQADAGVVRPALHGGRAGSGRGRWGSGGSTRRCATPRPPPGSASRRPSGPCSAGSSSGSCSIPPFVEFLIATEAEMNKVSWTSRDDLYRATSVVLTTVAADGRLPLRSRLGLVQPAPAHRRAEVRGRRRLRLDGRLSRRPNASPPRRRPGPRAAREPSPGRRSKHGRSSATGWFP